MKQLFHKFSKGVTLLAIVSMLTAALATTAFAAPNPIQPGYSPETAAAPTAGAKMIAANSWQWYIFEVQIPVGKDGDANKTTVDANLTNLNGTTNFQVWTPDNVRQWRDGEKVTPLGESTENKLDDKQSDITAGLVSVPLHFWQGGFTDPGFFYLIVMNSTDQPATYSLSVTGSNVLFPSQLTIPNATNTPVANVAPATAAPVSMAQATTAATGTAMSGANHIVPGYAPASAAAPTAGAKTIAANSWQWYIFEVQIPTTKDEDVNKTTVDVNLTNLNGTTTFQVWTPDNVRQWQNGEKVTPLGEGTENKLDNKQSDINAGLVSVPLHFWQGTFTDPGFFYLIVMNTTGQPATYTLSVTGSNVLFPSQLTIPNAQ